MEPDEYRRMDAVEDHMWWYRALRHRLLDALVGVRGTVLDAGCGTGGTLARLRGERPDLRLVGLEMAEPACRRTTAKARVPVVRGSVNAMPFGDGSLDAVIMADVLCHADVDPAAALAELRRVLRPGGRVIVNMPAYAWLMSAHDKQVHNARRYTLRQVRSLLERAGFGGIRGHYWNSLLFPLMLAQRKIVSRGNHGSDVAVFPPWLDALLLATTEFERRLPVCLPMGGSVLATAERP